MTPIAIPLPHDPSWARAEVIVKALRARGKPNPFIVAAVANALAESGWRAVIAGDHGQSFGPWQMKFAYYGQPILDALKIDIRTEPDLGLHVEALLWLLYEWEVEGRKPLATVAVALDAAKTAAEATRVFTALFERASAAGAVERRVAIAPQITVWLAKLPA